MGCQTEEPIEKMNVQFDLNQFVYFPGEVIPCKALLSDSVKIWWTSTLYGDSILSHSKEFNFKIPLNQPTGRFLIRLHYFKIINNSIKQDSITNEIIIQKTNGTLVLRASYYVLSYKVTFDSTLTKRYDRPNVGPGGLDKYNSSISTLLSTGKHHYKMTVISFNNKHDTLSGYFDINYQETKICYHDNLR
jgi:hypothetical protein